MPYKNKEDLKKWYQRNKERILAYQTKRWSKLYRNNKEFRALRQFREKMLVMN
mgnify:FL=1